jgi:toxin YoeB
LKVLFTDHGWEEYEWWCAQGAKALPRLNALIDDIRRHPFQGIGKPEALKADLSGFWARRITGEHRLVYAVSGKGETQTVTIVQCRYHY